MGAGDPEMTVGWFGRIRGGMRWGWFMLLLGPPLLTLLLVVAIWVLSLRQTQQESEQALAAIRQENQTLAHVVAANLAQVLARPQLYAEGAADLLDREREARLALRATLAGDEAYLRLVVMDQRKHIIFASSSQANDLMQSAETSSDGRLMLSLPSGHSDEAWQLPVSLGLRSPGGRDGYLVMLLDLGYFLRLYQGAGLGARRIGISLSDGRSIVEVDDLSISLGGRSGHGEEEAMVRVSKPVSGLPLQVDITQSEASIMAGLDVSRRHHLRWAWGLTLSLVLGGGLLTGLALRQRRLHQRVLASEQENRHLISKLEEEKGQAYQLASHDHLTGLPNRMLFSELSASHLSGARRARHLHALIFLDLDRFKAVNDRLGHHVGDLLLQTVALRLRQVLRDSDLVCRQGGDEFVLLVNELASVEDAGRVALKIIQVVGAPCQLEGHDLEVRPSLGVALAPQDGMDMETLMARADSAMYAAKAAGRGTYRFFDAALNTIPVRQDELARDFPPALEAGRLVLHFQIQRSARDWQPMGLEALVRWEHPAHGLVYPKDLLPLARELGLLPRLDAWVCKTACEILQQWQSRGYKPLPVTINVAPESLAAPDFDEQLLGELQARNISPALLALDIPGAWFANAQGAALARLDALAHQGVTLRAEGFGQGRVGFQHLRDLPVKCLKVEPGWVGEGGEVGRVGSTASFIITLAHVQGFRVLVSHVETGEQLAQLKAVGADGVQGYHIHRPAPVEEVSALLFQKSALQVRAGTGVRAAGSAGLGPMRTACPFEFFPDSPGGSGQGYASLRCPGGRH